MTTKAAEDFEDIARRLKELEADRQLALTGSTVPEPKEAESVYGEYAMGWPAVTNAQIANISKMLADNKALQSQPVFGNGLTSWFD